MNTEQFEQMVVDLTDNELLSFVDNIQQKLPKDGTDILVMEIIRRFKEYI